MEKYRQNMIRTSNSGMRMHTQNIKSGYSRMSGSCGCSDVRMSNDHHDHYDHHDHHDHKECTGLAMGKVKHQPWQNIYSCEKAITRGTIFADLDLPFMGRKGGCK